MLAEAQRRMRRSGLSPGRIRWIRGDASCLPFGTASADALTGHSFLYLLPDRQAALAEMLRVLQPGGRVMLMEPHERPVRVRAALASGRDPRHLLAVSLWRPFSRVYGRFSAASLADTLEAAGFVNAQVEEVVGGLGLLVWADRP
jgi:ubiquinone/menaquinone biosynthesis C-methylase UbiE